jgi:hypothetical protein
MSARLRTTGLSILASLVLVAFPTAALAGRGGKPAGGATSGGGSVSLVLLDPASTGPKFGDQVTFAVSTSYSTKWVAARCSQNGTLVYTENHGFFPDYPWGQTYTLGPTSLWNGGAASCSAELYTMSGTKKISLASTSFNVSG